MRDETNFPQRFSWFISMTADELYEATTARIGRLIQLRNEQDFRVEEYEKVLVAKGKTIPMRAASLWEEDGIDDLDERLFHKALRNREDLQREIDDYSKTRNFLARMDDGRQLMLKLQDYEYFFSPVDFEVY